MQRNKSEYLYNKEHKRGLEGSREQRGPTDGGVDADRHLERLESLWKQEGAGGPKWKE